MPYSPISEDEFNTRYQLLADYFKKSKDEGKTDSEIKYGLDHLPNRHPLKNKKFLVLNRNNRKSFLHLAAAAGDWQLIHFLKETGHDINLQDAQHKTPLYDACAQLKLASANHLLGYAAIDPNLGNGHLKFKAMYDGVEQEFAGDRVPLVVTIESKATVTARELSTATNEDFSQLTTEEATEQARARIVKILIAKDAIVNPQTGPGNFSPLHPPIINLQTGEENFSPLHRSIINLQSLIVKEITDSVEADPEKKKKTYTQVDRDGQAPLHMVVDYRNEEEKQKEQVQMQKEKQITELIIPHLEAINVQDKKGNTPLHTAVINSNAEVVATIYKNDYLFSQKKVLSIQNNAGNTALHEAILEAKRGPKVLAILLRVATEDDLAITNKDGETVRQLASRLTHEAEAVRDLADEVTGAVEELKSLLGGSNEEAPIQAPDEVKQLQEVTEKLFNHINHNRATNSLSIQMEGLKLDAEEHAKDDSLSLKDIQDLISRAEKIVANTQKEFFHDDYIKSLKSVHQLEYTAWKNQILQIPSSFPNLEVIDTQSAGYQADLTQAFTFFTLGEGFLAVNNNEHARTSIESAIPIYARLKNYYALERCYQSLAKTYMGVDDGQVTRYETKNQIKLHSLDTQEKLQGHLALGGLYKELREQNFASPSFSNDDLHAHESYHYYHAYKLTQGDLAGDAEVVLQHEMGIIYREKLGTYNIQQCVAVVAFNPDRITGTGKVVLTHFDRFSGPLSFIENLLKEFPGQNKIHLYIMGGRDRVSTVSRTSTTLTSDNNIEQVLKQVYAEQDRFVVKATDLGAKCPEAVVFDVDTQQLVHATPDRPDSSLPSREVNFFLQKNKADYLRPLNKVDFSQSLADRIVRFTPGQQLDILTNAHTFSPRLDQTAAWNHQQFYPLMTIENQIMGSSQNFQQGLLKKALFDRYVGRPGFTNLPCIASRRRRDVGLCEVDSERLLKELVDLPETEQSKVLEHVATRRVGGSKQQEIAKLVANQQKTNYLKKVGGISSGVMDGIFYEDALAGWLKGDRYPAIQLGYLKGSGYLLEKLSAKMQAKGLELALEEGKLLKSSVLRAGGCFLGPLGGRLGGLGFASLDLYNQASEYEKNPNNTAALVGMVTDGVQISTDLFAGGVEVVELSSETVAALGISAVTAPGAALVGGVVMLGNKIYGAVTRVNEEDHLLHLTTREKWIEGALAFLSLNSSFQKQLDEITKYESILLEQLEFLKKHPEIKHVIFPAIEKTGEKPRVCVHRPYKGCKEYAYPPIFTEFKDNSVYFKDKLIGFDLNREELTAPAGTELLCLPTAPTGEGISLPADGAYACDRAAGLSNKNASVNANAAIFKLRDGEDHAAGFMNISNIFVVNDGAKDFEGGDLEDTFIILAKNVVTAVNKEGGIGGLDGGPASDSLLVQGLQPAADRIEINLNSPGFIKNANDTLDINNIEKLLGGIFPLDVTVGCATEEIHLVGGPTLKNLDTLLIPKNSSCAYDLKMYLEPHVSVNNEADTGIFTYYILPGKGNVVVNLTATENNANTKPLNHQFVFNEQISDVSSLQVSAISSDAKQARTIKLHFLEHRMRTLLRAMQSISFTQSNAMANITITYQLKPDSALDLARFVLPTQLPAAQTPEVLKKHLVNPAADSFNVTLHKRHDIRHAVLHLIKDERVEDFKFELKANLSDNIRFNFIDNAELIIGNKNNYLFKKNLNHSVSEIMDRFAPTARRLNLICVLTTQEGEQIVIGHNGIEVMENNPSVRTHLNGNGGEAVAVIKSGLESLFQSHSRLPIKEVVLYRRSEDTHIDTIDLRALNEQVLAINATAKLLFIAPNKRNKLGHDLKIMFGMKTHWIPANKMIPIVSILLKDVRNHWHKQYLRIFLNANLPQQIAGRHSHLRLKPLPLEFGPQHDMAIVGIKNVEANTDLVIPYAYQAGAFFHHNKTNLLWTNMLTNSSNGVVPFALILDKFFLEHKLKTLLLQFTNKKIALKSKLAEMDATQDFEEINNAHIASLSEERLAILNSQQLLPKAIQNATEMDVRQENYLSNDINETFIEDHTEENHTEDYSGEETNEIDLFRRRRAVADASDPITSSASRLQSWIDFPQLIAENLVRTATEIFTQVKANIMDLSSYLPDMNFSGNPDLLSQATTLGNKTSHLNDQSNTIQEYSLNAQDVPLKKCVPLKLVDTDQEYMDGVSCDIPGARINFFHKTPFETCPAAFEQAEDNFANCQPLEWYGRPSVVCEGEKTTSIVTSHLPQRIFDPVNDWLMLGQLSMAIANKIFPVPVTDTRYQLVDEFSEEQALLWQTKLNIMKNQLKKLHTRVDGEQLKWIQYRLEDRQEEFDQFTQRKRVTCNEITEFTDNLFALEEMLDEIKATPFPASSSFPQQDNDVFARAAGNGNYHGQSSSFFSATANQANAAPLNGPAQTLGKLSRP